jgi:hypothetical protein
MGAGAERLTDTKTGGANQKLGLVDLNQRGVIGNIGFGVGEPVGRDLGDLAVDHRQDPLLVTNPQNFAG